MNTERLLANFDRVADAPDAVRRLRSFVLDLAVRGKLVEQDPADEPASELLRRITTKKARQIKDAKFKPRKARSRPRQVPLDFATPRGWELVDLGSIALKITDGAHKTPTYVDHGVPFVSVKDFSSGKLDLSNTRFITHSEHQMLYKRCDPRRGDILLSRIGTIGKAVLVDTDVEFSLFVSVGLIRFDHANINPAFFQIVLKSPLVESEFDRIKVGGGTHTNKLNLGDLHTVAIPLPPLVEQHLIVIQVKKLMAVCDRLEETQTAWENTLDRLTKVTYARLSESDGDDNTFRSHAHSAFDALPALTARSDQVKRLRQVILDLAMRGKLVEQDPADESASKLVNRIAAEKAVSVNQIKLLRDFDADGLGSIPRKWWAVPLLTLGRWASGSGFPKREQGGKEGRYFFLKVSDMNLPGNEKFITTANNCIDGDAAKRMKAAIHPAGTIIFPKIGGAIATNKRRILTRGSAIDNNCLGITFSSHIDIEWAYLLMTYFDFTLYQVGTAVPALQQGTLATIPVALPPLAEQHRIVAKVDELMVLCDRLEASLDTAETSRHHLLESLLREALNSA